VSSNLNRLRRTHTWQSVPNNLSFCICSATTIHYKENYLQRKKIFQIHSEFQVCFSSMLIYPIDWTYEKDSKDTLFLLAIDEHILYSTTHCRKVFSNRVQLRKTHIFQCSCRFSGIRFLVAKNVFCNGIISFN